MRVADQVGAAERAGTEAPESLEETDTRRQRIAPRRLIALTALLALIGAIWMSTAGRDLPYIHHPDEPTNLRVVDRMVVDGDPNPHTFHYPSLFYYLHAGVHLDGPVLGWMGVEQGPVSLTMGTSRTDTPGSVRVHRAVSVALGLVTVAAAYGATRVLTRRRAAALGAAVVLATSPTLTVHTRLVTPDVLATALVAAVLWATARLWRNPTWGMHVVAGALVGLAVSAKYNAAAAAAVVIAGAALYGDLRRGLLPRLAKLAAAGASAAAAFLATTPYALLDRSTFLEDLRFERSHYASGHLGSDGGAGGWYAHYLLSTETLLVAIALSGVAVALARRQWRPLALVSVLPVLYGAFVASQAVRNDRTILLVLPYLAVLSGPAVASAVDLVRGGAREPGARRAGSLVAAGVIGVGVLAAQGVRVTDALDLRPSTWERSREWVHDNVPPGSRLYIESYSPWIEPARYDLTAVASLAEVRDLPDDSRAYLVASEGMYGRYLDEPRRVPAATEAYRDLFARARTLATFDGEGPTIRVLELGTGP